MPVVSKDGEVLVRIEYASIDPYLRGRMNGIKTYVDPQGLNEVFMAGAVGEVIESRNEAFPVGAKVVSMGGWQQYYLSNGADLRVVDASSVPLSAYLGVVGMPGVTAWYGLNKIIKPKSGETVVVSAASGAVGAVVGQLAKLQGCRVVGIAGGKEKCDYVVKELGFDACVDYKSFHNKETEESDLAQAIRDAAPNGVDGYFENVGGVVGNAVLRCMNVFGRIAVCGAIACYDGDAYSMHNPQLILTQRLLVQGFIIYDHLNQWPAALAELGMLVATKKMKFRETVLPGLEHAAGGLVGILHGANFGKLVIKVN